MSHGSYGKQEGRNCNTQAGLLHNLCGSSPCSSTRAKLLETQEGLVRAERGFTSREESDDHVGKGEDNSDEVFHLY